MIFELVIRPLSLVFVASTFYLVGCGESPVAMKEAASRSVAVKTVAVAVEDVPRVTTQPATVHAYHRAEIRAQASGYVSRLLVDIGDYVEAGATLAEIAVPEMAKQRLVIEARVKRFQAEQTRAEAGVNLAHAKVESAKAKLSEANSMMDRADATLAAAEAEFVRTEDLVQRGSLQDRLLDESRKKRDSEAANKAAVASAIQSARAEVIVAEAQTASAEADVLAAEADTEIARSQLEELDVLIAYATVRAPFAGLVTERSIEPGDLVRQASEVGHGKPMFVISQVDQLRVRIPVPEADAPLVNPGDVVSLTLPSFPSETPIQGTVSRRSGSLDPGTRTMIVEADIPNPEGRLLPGMFGQASIDLQSKVAANMLPARAVRFREDGSAYVYVVGDDSAITVTPVTVGLDDGSSIEVVAGIKPGQRVVDAHLKRFTDGQRVDVLPN